MSNGINIDCFQSGFPKNLKTLHICQQSKSHMI